jgi:hypothetical protein
VGYDGSDSSDKLARKHIFVNIDDWQWYEAQFGGKNQLGTSRAIRITMRKFREAMEANASAKAQRVNVEDIEI